MFIFVKKNVFFSNDMFGSNAVKRVSMNKQECKRKPEMININSNEPLLYPYSIEVNKFTGSCNNINDPYAK